MLKTVAVVIAALIGAILIYAATKPDVLHVQRSARIKAPPEKIFALINDYREWGKWSPWERKDPAMKRSFSGSASGKGAIYAWDGDKNVGKGRMEITNAVPPARILIDLDFERPFEAHNAVSFTLEPSGDATNVVWSMQGPMPYMSKVMSVFIDMDDMIGKDFEAGLTDLKAAAERAS